MRVGEGVAGLGVDLYSNENACACARVCLHTGPAAGRNEKAGVMGAEGDEEQPCPTFPVDLFVTIIAVPTGLMAVWRLAKGEGGPDT